MIELVLERWAGEAPWWGALIGGKTEPHNRAVSRASSWKVPQILVAFKMVSNLGYFHIQTPVSFFSDKGGMLPGWMAGVPCCLSASLSMSHMWWAGQCPGCQSEELGLSPGSSTDQLSDVGEQYHPCESCFLMWKKGLLNTVGGEQRFPASSFSC